MYTSSLRISRKINTAEPTHGRSLETSSSSMALPHQQSSLSTMNAVASSSRLLPLLSNTFTPSSLRSASTLAPPKTTPIPGFNHFVLPLRKLIIDYNEVAPCQRGLRDFIRKPLVQLARENPEVEVLVRKVKQGKAGVLRGHYGMWHDLLRYRLALFPQCPACWVQTVLHTDLMVRYCSHRS